jgi:hypothetical protein
LLTLPVLLTTAALFIAAVALVRARRASRRLERLTESYWELRYEVAQMRARLGRDHGLRPAVLVETVMTACRGLPGQAALSQAAR